MVFVHTGEAPGAPTFYLIYLHSRLSLGVVYYLVQFISIGSLLLPLTIQSTLNASSVWNESRHLFAIMSESSVNLQRSLLKSRFTYK